MQTWMLVLILVLAVAILAPVIGILIGKQSVKRQMNTKQKILSKKESLICGISATLGILLVAGGVIYSVVVSSNTTTTMDSGFVVDGGGATGGYYTPANPGNVSAEIVLG